jgi:hypothetical protein
MRNLGPWALGFFCGKTKKRREKVDSYRMRSEGSIYMKYSIWSIPDQQCHVVVVTG